MTTKDKQQLIKEIEGMKMIGTACPVSLDEMEVADAEIYNQALDKVIELIKETNPSK